MLEIFLHTGSFAPPKTSEFVARRKVIRILNETAPNLASFSRGEMRKLSNEQLWASGHPEEGPEQVLALYDTDLRLDEYVLRDPCMSCVSESNNSMSHG